MKFIYRKYILLEYFLGRLGNLNVGKYSFGTEFTRENIFFENILSETYLIEILFVWNVF